MTPDRAASSDDDLRDRLDQTFEAARRQHEQLELAFGPWQGEDGLQAFCAAYEADDPGERNRCELVHGNFERHHQLVRDIIELGGKLAERAGSQPKPGAGEDRIAVLLNAGVITAADERLLREHTLVRNLSQHAYISAAPVQIHRAAARQLVDGRALLGRLAKWVEAWPAS